MRTTTKLCKDTFEKDVEQKLYKSMIGSLLYLIAIFLYISFSVGACVRLKSQRVTLNLN